MKKIKLKKNIKKLLVIAIILLTLGTFATIKAIDIYKQKQYEKTYEYKLITLGYDKVDALDIIDKYQTKEIDYILNNAVSNVYLDLINEPYFIYDNFYKYIQYHDNKENDVKNIRNTIEIVNTLRDSEYYSLTLKTNIDDEYLMLVNKYYQLDENYVPNNLVTISTQHSWGTLGSQKTIDYVYDAFIEMHNAAKEFGYYLMVSSSYRNYEKQETIYNDYKESRGTKYADSIAARPGYSEHQSGYALDIFEKNNYRQATFHESDVYNWLKDNSYKYGFILRYPSDLEDITGYSFESWHYRYVGKEVAKDVYQKNITFDEYYAYYIK